MSQHSHGYEAQSQRTETQPVYVPEPINLQQLEYQQSFSHTQQVPPQQNWPQPPAYYAYVQPVFVYPLNEPDSLSKIAGFFSYLGGWFSALLVLLFVRHNRFIRFHALQSLFLSGGMTVVYLAFLSVASFWLRELGFWHPGRLFFLLLLLAFALTNLIAAISWCVGIVGALVGKYVKLPFVGDLAERLTGGPVSL